MKTYTLKGIIQETVTIHVPGHTLKIDAGQEIALLVTLAMPPDSELTKVCGDMLGRALLDGYYLNDDGTWKPEFVAASEMLRLGMGRGDE